MLKKVVTWRQETGYEFLARCFPDGSPSHISRSFTVDKFKASLSSQENGSPQGGERSMDWVWEDLLSREKMMSLLTVATRPGVFPESILRRLAYRFVAETPVACSPDGTLRGMLTPDGDYAPLLGLSWDCLEGRIPRKRVAQAIDAMKADSFPSWPAKILYQAVVIAGQAASSDWEPWILFEASNLTEDFVLELQWDISQSNYVMYTHLHMLRQLKNPFLGGD